MTSAPASSTAAPATTRAHKAKPWLIALAMAGVVLLGTGFYFVSTYWPYRYRQVKPLLEDVLASQVTILHYHRTYFPNPGFVAVGLTLRRKSAPDIPPVGSAEQLIVQGSWLDLLMLRRRVRLVEITGLHVVIPPPGTRANHEDFPPGSSSDFSGPTTLIEELDMHKTVLDILRVKGGRYSFPIRELHIRNLQQGRAITYTVDMQNAQPSGHIQATGSFGPLNPNNLAGTPVSGNFTFTAVNLHDVGKISGTLASQGQFNGPLSAITAVATSNTPDFAVSSGRPTPVTGTVRCIINGLNGDVALQSIDARMGSTTIHATGAVGGSPKVTNLELSVTGGRVQDIMRPFVHNQVPLTGPVWLHAHAYLAPATEANGFFQRLQVDGSFDVPAEHLADPQSEQSLSAFSQRALGAKPPGALPDDASSAATDVLSSLKGPARIRNGIASTQRLTFTIPGAQANLSGTFNLHDETVHLTGNLHMDSDISHVTTGFKSLLLKPLTPFFKKAKGGSVLPVAVTGSPGKYEVTQNLVH